MLSERLKGVRQLHLMKTAFPWKPGLVGAGLGGVLGAGYTYLGDKKTPSGFSKKEERFENQEDMLLKQKERSGVQFGYRNKVKLALAKAKKEVAKADREHPKDALAKNVLIGMGAGAFTGVGGRRLLGNLLKGK